MTIKELYEWAYAQNVENYVLRYEDGDGEAIYPAIEDIVVATWDGLKEVIL